MTPEPAELPLDLAHLDDLRERIVQADEAIVSFVCLRVQLAREELAYRRERGLPEWDSAFAHRESERIMDSFAKHNESPPPLMGRTIGQVIPEMAKYVSGAVDDGRYDPATTDLGF